jgi:hypothetical protein
MQGHGKEQTDENRKGLPQPMEHEYEAQPINNMDKQEDAAYEAMYKRTGDTSYRAGH